MRALLGVHVLLKRICNNDGIRISELINTLVQVAPEALSKWTAHAQHFHDVVVPTSHWFDNIWRMPGAPKIAIRLDNAAIPSSDFDFNELAIQSGFNEAQRAAGARLGYEKHSSRIGYMATVSFRATREGEWIPKELFEPMESETGQSPINWDT